MFFPSRTRPILFLINEIHDDIFVNKITQKYEVNLQKKEDDSVIVNCDWSVYVWNIK